MRQLGAAALVLACVFSVVRSSRAAGHPLEGAPFPSCPNKKGKGDAEAHYNAGREAYDNRKLDRALPEFFEAYAMACDQHDVLLIISRSYELDRNYKDAIRALETYKQRTNDTSPENNALLAKLRETQKEEEVRAAQLAEAQAKAAEAAAKKPEIKTVEVRGHTPAPWVVAGTGGAALVTGLVFIGLVYKSPDGGFGKVTKAGVEVDNPKPCAVDAFPSAGNNGECFKVTRDGKEASSTLTFRNVGGWLVIGGAAAVAGGLLWHFLEPTGPETARSSRISPTISTGYVGADWSARF